VVRPSEIHSYVYCPRQFFFSHYMGRAPGLFERLRLLLGSLYHAVAGFIDKMRGYSVEEPITVDLGRVVMRGRPDSYMIGDDGTAVIIERKSGRGPRRGAWASDVLQAAAYAFMVLRRGMASKARLRIEYLGGGGATYDLEYEHVSLVLKAVEDIVYVKAYGVLPAANRSEAKCRACPFRRECYLLDEGLDDIEGDLVETGEWVKKLRIREL